MTTPGPIALVGHPNMGKSALFGRLTGVYATVSNYPGTTVEVTRGTATIEGAPWHVMDTPGTNNLLPMSEDEQVTRDILQSETGYVCLQVCDAKNLRRGLLLTAALALAVSGCTKPGNPDTIAIGEVASLTGKEAAFGQSSHRGTLIAIEELNAAGGVLGVGEERVHLLARGVVHQNPSALFLREARTFDLLEVH